MLPFTDELAERSGEHSPRSTLPLSPTSSAKRARDGAGAVISASTGGTVSTIATSSSPGPSDSMNVDDVASSCDSSSEKAEHIVSSRSTPHSLSTLSSFDGVPSEPTGDTQAHSFIESFEPPFDILSEKHSHSQVVKSSAKPPLAPPTNFKPIQLPHSLTHAQPHTVPSHSSIAKASTIESPVSPVTPALSSSDPRSINCKFVRAGCADSPNRIFRQSMEDDVTLTALPCGGTFLGVYDGHGGATAAQHAARSLHRRFSTSMDAHDHEAPEAFRAAYAVVDDELHAQRANYVGTTAVTAYLCPSGRSLVVANCGDSRAVLGDAMGGATRLSVDHTPSTPAERCRLEAAGAFVCFGRVNGSLSVSRALGDHTMKSAVISEPQMYTVALTPQDRFLILACDGLWDVVSDDEATQFVNALLTDRTSGAPPTPTSLARALVQHALDAGTTDNVSVIVAVLSHPDGAH